MEKRQWKAISYYICWIILLMAYIYLENLIQSNMLNIDSILKMIILYLSRIVYYVITSIFLLNMFMIEKSKSTILIEIVIIDIPVIFMACSIFGVFINYPIFMYLFHNRNILVINGAVVLGCEIYRYKLFLKKINKKDVNIR